MGIMSVLLFILICFHAVSSANRHEVLGCCFLLCLRQGAALSESICLVIFPVPAAVRREGPWAL